MAINNLERMLFPWISSVEIEEQCVKQLISWKATLLLRLSTLLDPQSLTELEFWVTRDNPSNGSSWTH